MSGEPVFLQTEDGTFPTRGNLFYDPSIPIKNVVIISPASGTTARFYFDFAQYLSLHGHPTLVFSHRYLGESFPPSVDLKDPSSKLEAIKAATHVNMSIHWSNDMKSAINYMSERFSDQDLIWVGHSNGAMLLTTLPSFYTSKITRSLFVAASNPSIYYRKHPSPQHLEEEFDMMRKRLDQARKQGYASGVGEIMTVGVVEEWWGKMLTENYIWTDPLSYAVETLIVCFERDHLIHQPEAIKQMIKHMPNAKFHVQWIDPIKNDWEECGHLNAFRRRGFEKRDVPGGIWEYFRKYIEDGTKDAKAEIEWTQEPQPEQVGGSRARL